jgi:hypothetical protein
MIRKVLIVAGVLWGIAVIIPLFTGDPQQAAETFMWPVTFVWGGLKAIVTFVQSLKQQ